jgi:hypothetical protein
MVDKKNPALAILVDYPGFNLRLAAQLKKKKYTGHLLHQSAGMGLGRRKNKDHKRTGGENNCFL